MERSGAAGGGSGAGPSPPPPTRNGPVFTVTGRVIYKRTTRCTANFRSVFAWRQDEIMLQDEDGSSVHPATLLRKLRSEKAGKYRTFRKNARLIRWREGSDAVAEVEIARDAVTIQSGEVWLALDGPKAVVPVVVISPCARIANGLRPENDRLKPHLLKDCESLGLHVFGKELSTTPTGTTYQGTGKDFTRRPRLLLHKVEAADVDADGVRMDETLTLSMAAT